jgi:transcriptional regulator with XRE-family HTH domain
MGNGLKALRQRAHMTQQQAADAFGLTQGGYVKIERGSRRLTQAYIEKACEVFGADVRDVLTGMERGESPASAALSETTAGARPSRINPARLARLLRAAQDKLDSLPQDEARVLIEAIVEAARKPPDRAEP